MSYSSRRLSLERSSPDHQANVLLRDAQRSRDGWHSFRRRHTRYDHHEPTAYSVEGSPPSSPEHDYSSAFMSRDERGRPHNVAEAAADELEDDWRAFDKAVDELARFLAHISAEFKELGQQFVQEVSAITGYAGQDILDELWRRKIRPASRDPGAAGSARAGLKCAGVKPQKLEDAMEEVISLGRQLARRPGSRTGRARSSDGAIDCRLRLVRKLKIGRDDLVAALRCAPKSLEGVKGFLTEAELVQTTIRTVSQEWGGGATDDFGDDNDDVEVEAAAAAHDGTAELSGSGW